MVEPVGNFQYCVPGRFENFGTWYFLGQKILIRIMAIKSSKPIWRRRIISFFIVCWVAVEKSNDATTAEIKLIVSQRMQWDVKTKQGWFESHSAMEGLRGMNGSFQIKISMGRMWRIGYDDRQELMPLIWWHKKWIALRSISSLKMITGYKWFKRIYDGITGHLFSI